eukprot:g956.t1
MVEGVEMAGRSSAETVLNPRVGKLLGAPFEKWEGGEKEPCFDIGTVNFVGRAASQAKFARVAADTDPGKLRKFMEHEWGLQPPEVLLCVTGTAGGVHLADNMAPRLVKSIQRGLVLGAENTGAWILTTGSSHGVSEFVSDAFDEFGQKDGPKKVPLIGIMPWGKTAGADQLRESNWRSDLAQYRKKKVKEGVHMGHNHSHFVLVDSGRQQWADDDPLRIKLEQAIIWPSKSWKRSEREAAVGSHNPWTIMTERQDPTYEYQETIEQRPHLAGQCSILIVIGGGPGTLNNVNDHVKGSSPSPVIVVAGSSRAADLLKRAKELYEEHFADEQAHSRYGGEQLEEAMRRLVLEADDFFIGTPSAEKMQAAVEQVCEIVRSESVEVFDAEDHETALIADTILEAIIRRFSSFAAPGERVDFAEVLEHSLELAIKWDFMKFAKNNILNELSSLNETSAQRVLQTGMQLSLEENRPHFVKLFLRLGAEYKRVDIYSLLFTAGVSMHADTDVNRLLPHGHDAAEHGLGSKLTRRRPKGAQLYNYVETLLDLNDPTGSVISDSDEVDEDAIIKSVVSHHHDGHDHGHEDDHVHQLRLSAEVIRMIKETSARRVQGLQGHGDAADGGSGDEASFRAESRVLVWAIAMLHLDIATVVIELSASPLRMLLLGFRLLQALKKSKIAKRFLAQKLRIMEVSKDYEEMAIELLHEEAPEYFLEVDGMFDQLVSIAHENPDIVCTPVMVAAIQQKWDAFGLWYFFAQFAFFLLLLAVYIAWAVQAVRVVPIGDEHLGVGGAGAGAGAGVPTSAPTLPPPALSGVWSYACQRVKGHCNVSEWCPAAGEICCDDFMASSASLCLACVQRFNATEGCSSAQRLALSPHPVAYYMGLFVAVSVMIQSCLSGLTIRYRYQLQMPFSPSSVLEILFILFSVTALVLYFTDRLDDFRNLVSLSMYPAAMRLLYLLRGFKDVSYMIRIIIEVIQDMRPFLIILGVTIVSHSYAFFLLFSDDSYIHVTFKHSMLTMVHLVFDYFDTNESGNFRDDYPSPLSMILFVLYMLVVVIVLLNLLIALMSDSYDKIREKHVEQSYLEQANIIIDMQATFVRFFASKDQKEEWFPRTMNRLSFVAPDQQSSVTHSSGSGSSGSGSSHPEAKAAPMATTTTAMAMTMAMGQQQRQRQQQLTVRDLSWSGRVYAIKKELTSGQRALEVQVRELEEQHAQRIAEVDAKLHEKVQSVFQRVDALTRTFCEVCSDGAFGVGAGAEAGAGA